MSPEITQPIDSNSCELFDPRDIPVFVPPDLRLQLPSSLFALNLDVSRLWLTRTPRRPHELPQTEQDNDQFRARTPVFTRPSVPDAVSPLPDSILPMPMPIKLPQLLSLDLTMALPEPGTMHDGADNTSVLSSTVGDFDLGNTAMRAWKESVGMEVGDARYVAPLLRSLPTLPRDVVELPGWEREWNLMRSRNVEDDWGSEDVDEELDIDDDALAWPTVAFDEAYLGDVEDNWTDNEEGTSQGCRCWTAS